ncbi:MAG: M48 family metallopeptidase [Synergistaceae bacterium]|nr:M48 family metallopeptidase [Synergistaceae bacterium]
MADIVTLGGKVFEIRKDKRRTRIVVGIDSCRKYFIGCPSSYTEDKLKKLLSKNIEALISSLDDKISTLPPEHKYEEGELFLFRGKEYPLVWNNTKEHLRLDLNSGAFLIPTDKTGEGYKAFELWYKRALYNELRSILPLWTKALHVTPGIINIKTVKTAWGSCSSKGSITFCTRLALVPPELLEYVVVHELCHMLHMNHSPLFWAEVAKYIPDFKDKRTLLRKNAQIYKW